MFQANGPLFWNRSSLQNVAAARYPENKRPLLQKFCGFVGVQWLPALLLSNPTQFLSWFH